MKKEERVKMEEKKKQTEPEAVKWQKNAEDASIREYLIRSS